MSAAWRKITAGLDHRWAQPRMSAYLEGDLSPRQERRLKGHARICPECGQALRKLAAMLRTLPLLRAQSPVADRTAEAVRRRLDAEAPDGPAPPSA